MPNEIVDLINVNDEVIGQEWKYACHDNLLLHRGAGFFVFKDETMSEILLQLRSKNSRIGDHWCQPGGHVKAGESYLDAGLRELVEEVFSGSSLPENLEIKELTKFIKSDDHDREMIKIFYTIYPGPFFAGQDEVQNLKFKRILEIKSEIESGSNIYTDTFKTIFINCFKQISIIKNYV